MTNDDVLLPPRSSMPVNFQFSQASLNDYVDCPRRFQLRYVLEQDWPAVESEPLIERERLADLGRRFHRLVQQHIHGLPVEQLTRSASTDPDLLLWWHNYLHEAHRVGGDADRRQAEVTVSVP